VIAEGTCMVRLPQVPRALPPESWRHAVPRGMGWLPHIDRIVAGDAGRDIERLYQFE
jgi:hypothetical protein